MSGDVITRLVERVSRQARTFERRGVKRPWTAGGSRWSPLHATRDEERLHRRLGRGTPGEVAADAETYARWQSALVRAARERLFKDFTLRLQGRLGHDALVWRNLSVGERRLLLAGVVQHALDLILRKPAQQFPQQGAVRHDLSHADGGDVASVDHSNLSCGLRSGDDAESGAGETSSPVRPAGKPEAGQ